MAGIKQMTAEELAQIQKTLGLKLPPDFIRFAAIHALPELRYLNGDDLDELTGLDATRLIALNENLRDHTLNPEGRGVWQEEYFALGIRASDDAVYYLDTRQNAPISSVYALEVGSPTGQLVSGNFTRWAESMLEFLVQEDARVSGWHERQQPAWLRWLNRIIAKK